MKAVHDLAVHDAHRADLDDAAGLHVGVGGLKVERDITIQRRVDLLRIQELEGLEDGEGIGGDDYTCGG